MTNLQFHPKVAPESTANSAGTPRAASNDEALESLRHNQTHTLPPGARVAWLSHRLQELPEEHLRATDDLCRDADDAAGVQRRESLRGGTSRRRASIVLLAGLVVTLSGAIAFYVFANRSSTANHPTQVTTHANPAGTGDPAGTGNAPESRVVVPDAPESRVVAPDAPESRVVVPLAATLPAVLASVGVTREPVAPPRLREPAMQDKPKQAAPQKKAPIKAATSPAEPKAAVDEILFKSR